MIRSIAAAALAAVVTSSWAVPANASATDDVRAAMMKFAALHSFRMTLDASGGTMDFVKPDAMHMSRRGMEMYIIDKTMYVRRGPKGWTKIENSGGSGVVNIGDFARITQKEAAGVTATDLGLKPLDGKPYHAYRMTKKNGKWSTVYVGLDGYVHRIEGDKPRTGVTLSNFNGVAPFRAPI